MNKTELLLATCNHGLPENEHLTKEAAITYVINHKTIPEPALLPYHPEYFEGRYEEYSPIEVAMNFRPTKFAITDFCIVCGREVVTFDNGHGLCNQCFAEETF